MNILELKSTMSTTKSSPVGSISHSTAEEEVRQRADRAAATISREVLFPRRYVWLVNILFTIFASVLLKGVFSLFFFFLGCLQSWNQSNAG